MTSDFGKYNKWLKKQIETGFFKDIVNIHKIPNVEFLNSNYEYVLFHVYLLDVTTVNDLEQSTGMTNREVRNSIKKLSMYNLIERSPVVYYGNIINFITLSKEGLKRVYELFDVEEKKLYNINFKDVKHYVEGNSLLVEMYRKVKDIDMKKEHILSLYSNEKLRADALFNVYYDSGVKEQLLLEHDRGTERKKELEKKLEQYSIAMRLYKINNVLFSISKEDLMTRNITSNMWKITEIENINYMIKKLIEIFSYFKSLKIDTVEDIRRQYHLYKKYQNSNRTPDNYGEEINNILPFFIDLDELLTKIKIFRSSILSEEFEPRYKVSKIKQKLLDYFNRLKRDYFSACVDGYLLNEELKRCNLIKSIISNQPDFIEISKSKENKIDYKYYKALIVDGINPRIRSFKYLLLEHECLVLPVQHMKKYYDWKLDFHLDLSRNIANYFNLEPRSYNIESQYIELYIDETKLVKKENSFIIQSGESTYGFIIFDSKNVFSDELKLEVIRANIDQLRCNINCVYWIDIAECEWKPNMGESIFKVHPDWSHQINKIVNKQ